MLKSAPNRRPNDSRRLGSSSVPGWRAAASASVPAGRPKDSRRAGGTAMSGWLTRAGPILSIPPNLPGRRHGGVTGPRCPFTHSGGLTDALVFGRLAGHHAVGATMDEWGLRTV